MHSAADQQDLLAIVRAVDGRGAAGGLPRAMPLTSFHATRLRELGDVVMAISRAVDADTMAPSSIEIRVFRADTPGRGELPSLEGAQLLARDGGLAWVETDLHPGGGSYPYERPAERVALVRSFHVTGADSAERRHSVDRGLADWVRSTLEAELLLAGYLGLQGDAQAFDPAPAGRAGTSRRKGKHKGKGKGPTGNDSAQADDFSTWAAAWLQEHDYAVLDRQFAKAINPRLLDELGDVAR